MQPHEQLQRTARVWQGRSRLKRAATLPLGWCHQHCSTTNHQQPQQWRGSRAAAPGQAEPFVGLAERAQGSRTVAAKSDGGTVVQIPDDYLDADVKTLRKLCKSVGLSTDGKKTHLVARLAVAVYAAARADSGDSDRQLKMNSHWKLHAPVNRSTPAAAEPLKDKEPKWIRILHDLPGLSEDDKARAKIIILDKPSEDRYSYVSGGPDMAVEMVKHLLALHAASGGIGRGQAARSRRTAEDMDKLEKVTAANLALLHELESMIRAS